MGRGAFERKDGGMKERKGESEKEMWVWGWDHPLIEGKVGRRLVEFTYSELLSKSFGMCSLLRGNDSLKTQCLEQKAEGRRSVVHRGL